MFKRIAQTTSTTKRRLTQGNSRRTKHLLLLTAFCLGTVFLQPTTASAGTGTFREGKFNFCVSIRFNATEAQLQRIREVFTVANQVLADATDGQHQFGTISIINNSGAADQADFWIHPAGGRANASGSYGARGNHVNLFYAGQFLHSDTMHGALTIIHEFAHLAYDVRDEYWEPGQPEVRCPGDDVNSPTLNYCLMDFFTRGSRILTANYSVNEFCVDSNHDKPYGGNSSTENDTAQSKKHNNDSCWETMSKLQTKWRLTLPSGLPQDAQPSVQPVIFNTTCASQTQRVVLLIDRSGSMSTQDRLGFAKRGARHFVELYGAGDQLGIVSFATTASVNSPLTQIDATARSNAIAALSPLSAAGSTNTGDGLLAALSLLNSGDCQDCQKTIILLSDGDSNVGLPPESLIQTLQASDVKVIAATVGSDISVPGERSLKTISLQTGGSYLRAYRSLEFIDFLVRLAFGTSGYRGVANAPNFIGSSQVREIPVLVETGAVNTNFGISLGDQTDNVTLALRKPSGSTLTESNAPTGQFTSNSGLKVFKIPAPEAGTWTMVLTSGTVQSGSVQTFAYAQHDGTDFWASIDDDNVLATETLRVHATPTHDGKNVVGASVTGYVTRPDGSQVSITLFDDGAESHGDLSANDGVYSGLFASYSASGTYTFDLKYQNATGQTYTGEALPNENGVVETFPPSAVPPAVRITSVTAIVEGISNGDLIWFDDALPEGATAHADGDVDWYWVDANPGSFSGTKAHQSRNFGQLELPNSFHQHSFEGATTTLPVNAGDKLFTYVFLDINHMPREIMLQWKDGNGWEHRAYWGANNIDQGVDGTNSRRYMGPLPKAGQWVRLEVPANLVGLEGSTLNGMAFTLDAGRATFDLAGKTTANAPPPPTTPSGDFVWVDDAVPAGSTLETVDDQWQWIEPHVCGTQGHRSHFSVNRGNGKFRSHSFRNAPTTMSVNPGDVLFTYVYLDANHMPDQLMLQWHDGRGWEHRAFWGENYIGQKIPNMGVQGTESQRYMGGIPPGNQWVRLEVPASYVGLEGKTVSGMAFGFYSRVDKAGINWDCSGKSPDLTTVPLPLSATSSVWRLYSNTYGWSYNTNDHGEPEHIPQKKDVFFTHPNEAAGTVPMHRFRKSGYEYFYHTCRTCTGSEWQYEGIAFYVHPNASTPGTVPLYLYHDNRSKYFLTVNQNEAAGMMFDDIWGYVYSTAGSIPSPPTGLRWDGAKLVWRDNSLSETGYKVEKRTSTSPAEWTTVFTLGPNAWFFKLSYYGGGGGVFRVKAFNTSGDSENSNEALAPGPVAVPLTANTPPSVNIVSPLDGEEVANGFAISANAFDVDGNGTIGKVEFFANGTKLGETSEAPYVFAWNNAPPGSYSLTAVATDSAEASTTSAPVNVIVGRASQTILFDAIADKTYGDAPFAITAQASSGLPVSFTVVSGAATVSGNNVTITGAGPVTVRASQSGDTSYSAAADVDVTFNVAKASAAISLGNLNQTFDGSAKNAIASTNPAGLSGVSITYDGSATAPTNAGSYTVVASLTNTNYSAPDAIGSLTVAKASAIISLSNLSHVYDGTAKNAIASTNPAGLSGVTITYNGSATLPTNAGSYAVLASLANDNYAAADVTATLSISKAAQTIAFDRPTTKVYGNSPFPLTATSSSGLPVGFVIVSGPASLSGNTLTLTASGTVTVRAFQGGDQNYNAAPNVDRAFTVLPPASTSDTFRASTDFSTLQGYRNWYYLDGNGNQMAWDSNGWWQGPETYLRLWSTGDHPGNYIDSVRQWRAPSSGSIRITGTAYDHNAGCGDGVVVSIRRGTQVVWQQTIENGNATGFSYDVTMNVAAGDPINFVVNGRSACWCDGTTFDPTITLTRSASSTYQAYADYSNLQGQRNWYYLDGNGNQMTFNAGGSWQGPETYLLLGSSSDHPGNYTDSVRQWRAPSSGSIRITGTAYDQSSGCGDGVIVSVKHGTQLLWQGTINNGNATGFSYDLTRTVAAGDQINFVTNGRSACWCDSTSFNSTIVLTPPDSTPFSGTPISLPGTIQVEDFDNGGEGFAYHDTTPGNAGGQYRSNTDVDVGGNTSGYNVGWTISGEWTKYTVNVTTTDTYTIEAVVSSVYCCAKMHIEVDGVDVTGPMTVPNTGAWGAWQTISKSGVIIYSGNHTVRLVIDSPDGFLIDSIRLVPAPPP